MKKVLKVLKWVLLAAAALLLLAGLVIGAGWWYLHPALTRTNGLVYGQRLGHDLTVDVMRPAHPNGFGVVVMASGGWKSEAGSFQAWIGAPLLRRGYTLFAVYHVSQPEATIGQIVQDVNRGVRYVRRHARDYGVDPRRVGVTGGSSGGHLALMLATRGGPGPADAPDPLDRESSAVQVVAIFYPVTDFLNLGKSTENPGNGGPPIHFAKGFGPEAADPAAWPAIGRALSPIYFVKSNLPPTLIYHGDADTLVPLDQSQRFVEQARSLGCRVELVVHHRGRHGWYSMVLDLRRFADWFDRYLPKDVAP